MYLPGGHDSVKFRRVFRIIAIAMILFPVSGLVLEFLLGVSSAEIFFIEAAVIVTFGVYWTVKSYKLSLSRLESGPAEALQRAAKR